MLEELGWEVKQTFYERTVNYTYIAPDGKMCYDVPHALRHLKYLKREGAKSVREDEEKESSDEQQEVGEELASPS
jgi:hypothetical protein